MAEIKDRIILLRQEKNMTQGELAKALNMAPSSIGMYEQGRRKPSYELLEKISDYFNVDMDYLMGRSDIKNRYQAGLKYDWEEEPTKPIDPIIEEYKLDDYELAEYNKILNMNMLMFNDKELSEEGKEKLQIALKEVFVEELLKRRAAKKK